MNWPVVVAVAYLVLLATTGTNDGLRLSGNRTAPTIRPRTRKTR